MTWDAKRILRELADGERRNRILRAFWRHGDATAKAIATAKLARALRFREETLRKLPAEKKSDLLASRIGSPEFDETLETALMLYHTREASDMLAAFLDRWHIPHIKGSIEVEDYPQPSAAEVRAAVQELDSFDARDVAIYLASAGLLMGEHWAEACWPVADEINREASPLPQG